MIFKAFYDEEDYRVVKLLLNGYKVDEKDIARVRIRQLLLESFDKKKRGD